MGKNERQPIIAQEMNSREQILSKISKAKANKKPYQIITKTPKASGLKVKEGDLAELFKSQLALVNGECHILKETNCTSQVLDIIRGLGNVEKTLVSQSIKELLPDLEMANTITSKDTTIGISGCEYLVTQTGTAVCTARDGRKTLGLSPIHIILAHRSQLIDTLDRAMAQVATTYNKKVASQLTLITGPSRTADIEKTLILGAHGPKQLVVIIYDKL